MRNRSLRIGLAGCGYWGKNLARNFHGLGSLEMVADPTEEGRNLAAEVAPHSRVVSDFSELLNSNIAGVAIATPAETHHTLVKVALEAGKDVFVEKPLALTYEQGKELVSLARRKNRILMVGHVLDYHPAIQKLLNLIEIGELGKVNYIYSNRLNLGKVRREENILWSFAPHDIAIILRIMGTLPFEVVACGGSYVQPNIADVTVTNLLFENGVRAHIFVSWLHPFKEQRLVVIGSEKMASFDGVANKLLLYDQKVRIENGIPVSFKSPGVPVQFSSKEPLRLECKAYLQAIETRKAPLTDGVYGVRALRVLQAAQRSLVSNGEPVSLPVEV